jgi:hypothetical protein
VSVEWRGFESVRVHMPSFRRPLSEALNPLIEVGFFLERIIEPKPIEEFKNADPKHFEELSRQPCFICIRVRK